MYYIGVIGTASCSPEVYRLAEEVGKEVARKSAVLLCGGRGGVMEAASRGASLWGGTVIGILPGTDREDQNPYLTYSIVTGLNDARNAVIARSSHAVIAVCGGYGTLSEIGLALKAGIPVIGLKTWNIKNSHGEKIIQETDQPTKAVAMALQLAQKKWGEI
ncbi:TIGR00725 family protein [Candidatus Contubernalis alkaliaceticus]|uniref:TIGR00725 family protein n=1 Tax=Candidatus Contubernalis alkaliaceticus TaxID=338645 RepID=UPI001F4C111C|nr:TIGR00725 family protein [Candidatus Contubernalis alkalaceticus]UNC92701.1 TIGR00725 family protein [Candidatus Contubernalis alkalaceticus]